MDITIRGKSIRLDVYVEDEYNTVYNIEMQTLNKKNLPKRSRYYQGMIDLNIIDKGEDYNKLKKSYVIFICDYDEFGYGRHIYTFEKTCNEVPDLKLGDDTTVVVLNTKGILDDVSEDVKELLEYIGGALPQSSLTKSIDDEVTKVKSSEEWRREYMTLNMLIKEERAEAREEGKRKLIVSTVRNCDEEDLVVMAKTMQVDLSYLKHIQSLISEHPQLDDEAIVELL